MSLSIRSRLKSPYLLILPSVVILASLVIYPIGFALVNSFYFWNLQTSPVPLQFVGLSNFELVFQTTPFLDALYNTLILAIGGTFIQFWLGMGIALLLTSHLRGMTLVRVILIMPTTIAPVVAGFLFRYMFYEGSGLITWLLTAVGFPVPPEGILGSARTALAGIALADIWQWTPFFAIVLYAGLLSIPDEILEAARVDGASGLRLFTGIILPLVSRTAIIVIMIRFMQLFNMFDLVLVLTRGGPGTASRTLSYNLYQEGLVNFNIGIASAMTWLIVIIVTILINVYLLSVFRNWER
jgi:multiple sugar transport system permease protein